MTAFVDTSLFSKLAMNVFSSLFALNVNLIKPSECEEVSISILEIGE